MQINQNQYRPFSNIWTEASSFFNAAMFAMRALFPDAVANFPTSISVAMQAGSHEVSFSTENSARHVDYAKQVSVALISIGADTENILDAGKGVFLAEVLWLWVILKFILRLSFSWRD